MGTLSTDRFSSSKKSIESKAKSVLCSNEDSDVAQFIIDLQKKSLNDVIDVPSEFINLENLSGRKVIKNSKRFIALVESIKNEGLLQPPTVFVRGYEIFCLMGAHRIEACQELGITKIPCLYVAEPEKNHRDIQFMENQARVGNNPVVVAEWIKETKTIDELTNADLAKRIGKDREYIRRYEKIADWPEEVKLLIVDKPDFFSETFLLNLAKRKLKKTDLIEILKEKIQSFDQSKSKSKSNNKNQSEFVRFKRRSIEKTLENPKFSRYKKTIEEFLSALSKV